MMFHKVIDVLFESFNNTVSDIRNGSQNTSKRVHKLFFLGNSQIDVHIIKDKDLGTTMADVSFTLNGKLTKKLTDKNVLTTKDTLLLFGTIYKILNDFLQKNKDIVFIEFHGGGFRQSLYKKLVKKLSTVLKAKNHTVIKVNGNETEFKIYLKDIKKPKINSTSNDDTLSDFSL